MLLEKAGIPKRTVTALNKKNIFTTDDLVKLFPRAYRDYREITPIGKCVPDGYYCVAGKLLYVDIRKGANRQYLVAKIKLDDPLSDPTGRGMLNVMYFSGVYMFEKLYYMKGRRVVVSGKVALSEEYGYSISEPDGLVLEQDFKSGFHRLYPNVKGVSASNLMQMLSRFLPMQQETLEPDIYERYGLVSLRDALYGLHFPNTYDEIDKGRRRILFDDLLYFAMSLKQKFSAPSETNVVFHTWKATVKFIGSLPFELTGDQKKVINTMFLNAKRGVRNNVLLQGDVGCGKTIVAVAMMLCAHENGYQSVLMAPREVLAKQHFLEVEAYASQLGIKTAYLHSGMKVKEKKAVLKAIASGEISIVVGTHSCVSEAVVYKRLGVIITDEEHLFGVRQKEELMKKAVSGVHSVAMSATPIPRTFATVLYGGERQIAIIKELPKGRIPIHTEARLSREGAYPVMEREIRAGHQCYVVCPAIEANEEFDITSIEDVELDYRHHFEPKGVRIGIVNGKMNASDVAEMIDRFVKNEIQILISTTVIEVGVNVPNTTVMVIEQADRFGLASLHQLRGRVGRSSFPSVCILLSEDTQNERIKVMCETTDGFKIAEADFAQRGSGNLLGTEQSGMNKYVEEMLNHPDLFQSAQEAADICMETGMGRWLLEAYDLHQERVS